jgi:hypothetical protein
LFGIQIGVKCLLAAALLCYSIASFAVSGTFRGTLVGDPVTQDSHQWVYLRAPNGSIRRVEISRAEFVYGEEIGREPHPAKASAALQKGTGVRVTASQDESGEWAATRVEIIQMPPK